MAIDPQFEANRKEVGEEDDVAVWGPVNPSGKHGIHGTHITADFDICLADGACLEDCPMNVFTWVNMPGHPESGIKAGLTHEDQCIDCMLCVDARPVDTIDIDPGRAEHI